MRAPVREPLRHKVLHGRSEIKPPIEPRLDRALLAMRVIVERQNEPALPHSISPRCIEATPPLRRRSPYQQQKNSVWQE